MTLPFLYELKLQDATKEFTFVQQLVPVGSLVGTGQAVGTVTDGSMEFHVQAPAQGLLVEWFVHAGTEVQGGDVLARVVCEGERVEVDDVVPMRLG